MQIVYVLIANENNLYLEEFWVSIFSVRLIHSDINIKVLVDVDTEKMIISRPKLMALISEMIVVPTPRGYNAKQRSRQIKTSIREIIKGPFLFIDTDTVVCKSLMSINEIINDINLDENPILAVPDGHLPLKECLFPPTSEVKRIFNVDCSDAEYWFNSGVMYVADTPIAHKFYKKWNENWRYSCFEKGNSQDQPALLKTNRDFEYIIRELPGIYNVQVALSLKYLADAVILHWWHMDFISNQSFSPYFSLQIYEGLKNQGCITEEIKEKIVNVKQSFTSPTMPVGSEQILFLFSPAGRIFNRIFIEGGVASWLMLKFAIILEKIHLFTHRKK